jgi:radical SAM superfamily enzyme YgiQ (UPF0313 family)
MNILLIPAPAFEWRRFRSYQPIGLYSIQAAAARAGYAVDVLNLESLLALEESPADSRIGDALCDLFDPADYDIIGLTTISGVLPIALFVAERVRAANPKACIVLGGPHVSFLHQETLADFPCIDAVVVGEGEMTFVAMLEAYRGSPVDWTGIPGVATRHGSFVPRPLIPDLDALPYIDFSRLPDTSGDSSFVRIDALRGCYGRCRFCSTTQFWQRRVRRKSSARLIEEMERGHDATGVNRFLMVGDNFAKDRPAISELCRRIRQKGHGWEWCCAMTIADSSREELEEMRDAGCVSIFVGVESPNQNTLDRMSKRVDADRTTAMIQTAIALGIEVSGSQIIGFPWETEQDIIATIRHHKKLLEMGAFPCDILPLVPIPGARGFDETPIVSDVDRMIANLPWHCREEYVHNLIARHPRHFTYFSYYETPHVSRQFIIAAADASNQIIGMMELQRTAYSFPDTAGQVR